MTTRQILVIALGLLGLLGAAPGQEIQVIKEFPRYQRPGGQTVRGVVIAPNPSLDGLIALATRLYREDPSGLVILFTDGDERQFHRFKQWDLHETKPDAALYPKPEKWLERYELGIVHRTNLGRPGGWRNVGMLQIFNHKDLRPPVPLGTTATFE